MRAQSTKCAIEPARWSVAIAIVVAVMMIGCADDEPSVTDAATDAAVDAVDAGAIDGGDATDVDAGVDASVIDAADVDAGVDASVIDAAVIDAGVDASVIDAAVIDAGVDASAIDAAVIDAGVDAASPDGPPADGSAPVTCTDQPAAWPAPNPPPPPAPHTHLVVFPSAAIDFGTAINAMQTVYVINNAATAVGPVWVDFGGGDAFWIQGFAQGSTLAPSAALTIVVRALDRRGLQRGAIRVHTPGQTIELTMVQNAPPDPVPTAPLELSAPPDTFYGNNANGATIFPVNTTMNMTVRNVTATESHTVSSATVTGPWQIVSNGCGTLAPGATCTIQVRGLAISTTTLQLTTSQGTLTRELGAQPFLSRVVTVNGPGRVRSSNHRIDCQGPGECTVSYPALLCFSDMTTFPAAGHRATTTWQCASGSAQHYTATIVPDPGLAWSTTTGQISASAIGDGGRVAVLAELEWDATQGVYLGDRPTSVRIFVDGAEVARRTYPDTQLAAVAARPGGFIVAGAEDGRIWVDALDAMGGLLWRRSLDPGRAPRVWAGPGGHVYVQSGTLNPAGPDHRHLTALAPDGAVLWTREVTEGAFIGADGLGLGYLRTIGFASYELVRWSPNGGISAPRTVQLAPECDSAWDTGDGSVRLLGDGGRLTYRADSHANCLSYATTDDDGAPRASGAHALPPSFGLGWAYRIEARCGTVATMSTTHVRFLDAALAVSATWPLGQAIPVGAPEPTTFDVGVSGQALATANRSIAVFNR